MERKRKSNKKLMAALILTIFITIAIWGIVLGLYFYNEQMDGEVNTAGETQGTITRGNLANEQQLGHKRLNVYKANNGPITRFVYEALVDGEVSKRELITMSENIVKEMIEERRGFQALAIHYYTHEELLEHSPALGIYTYAPDGDWNNAGTGKVDFSNFRGNSSELVDKDWGTRPTSKEIEMFKIYSGYEYADDGITRVASQYEISFEEAQNHINNVMNWVYR